jgi:hypothetical protein
MSGANLGVWSGLDLEPLPHESSLSVLWRFGWRNAVGTPQLAAVCRDERTFRSNVSFYKSNWIDSQCFAEQTGWHLPPAAERDIATVFEGMVDAWFDQKLRMCPFCMQDGYHSLWFQFRPLAHCPLHDCELRCTCQDCGSPLEDYAPSRKLLQRSYHCKTCANPIAGAPLLLRNHLELRECQADIEIAFRPLAIWLIDAKERFNPLKRLCLLNGPWRNAWTQWCRPVDFIQSVGHALHPLPAICKVPLYRELAFIRWRAEAGPLENIHKDELRAAIWGKGGEAILIYRGVLRLLQSALPARFPEIGSKRSVHAIDQYGPVKLWTRDPLEFGFQLLRTKLERGDVDLARPIETAQFWDEPSIPLPWNIVGLPKAALRAMYVAMYANLVHSLENARKSQNAKLSNLDLRDQTLVAHSWWQEEKEVTGFFVFPPVDKIHLF